MNDAQSLTIASSFVIEASNSNPAMRDGYDTRQPGGLRSAYDACSCKPVRALLPAARALGRDL